MMKLDSDVESINSNSSGLYTEWMDNIPSYEESTYFIPDLGDDEIDSSLMMHYTYKYMCQGNFISPLEGEKMKKCLEIGYGSGIWMMEMAAEYPDCDFYGIDVQPNTPDSTYPDNCEFIRGDIKNGIPFPDESFDFVYLRMTMIFIETDQWKYVISEIVRVLKKGGWVEFLETDMTYRPSGKIMKMIMKFWREMYRARNIDVSLTRQFGTLLSEKGLINVQNKKYSVPMGNWAGALGEIRSESFKTWLRITADFSYAAIGFETKEKYLEQIDALDAEFAEIKPHGDHYIAYGQKPFI